MIHRKARYVILNLRQDCEIVIDVIVINNLDNEFFIITTIKVIKLQQINKRLRCGTLNRVSRYLNQEQLWRGIVWGGQAIKILWIFAGSFKVKILVKLNGRSDCGYGVKLKGEKECNGIVNEICITTEIYKIHTAKSVSLELINVMIGNVSE